MENITKNEIKIKMLDVLLELNEVEIILFKKGCDIYEKIWVSYGEEKEIEGDFIKYVGGCSYKKYGWNISEKWVYDLSRNKREFIKWNNFIRHTLIRYVGEIINEFELLDIYKEVINFWVKERFEVSNYSKICKESKYYLEKRVGEYYRERIKNIGYKLEDEDKLIDDYKWSINKGNFIKIDYLEKYKTYNKWNLFIGEYESELDDIGIEFKLKTFEEIKEELKEEEGYYWNELKRKWIEK